MTVVAIHQPNYLPWLGFFGKALDSDVFVLHDNVQFEKGGYTNRVRIKGSQGAQWLTQPVFTHGRAYQEIRHVELVGSDWRRTHLRFLRSGYGRAPHFRQYFDQLSEILGDHDPSLATCNARLIDWLFGVLGLHPRLVRASDLVREATDPTERLIRLVEAVGGDTYLSGGGGFNYQDLTAFNRAGIRVTRSRSTFPAYPQLWGAFVPGLSIVDLLFNCGPMSRAYLAQGALEAEAIPVGSSVGAGQP
jgi:hypothetical protein